MKRTRWKRGDVTRTGNSSKPIYITGPGWLYGDSGLAVAYNVTSFEGPSFGNAWRIIHAPTGLSIGDTFDTFKQAKTAVKIIAPVTDWQAIRDTDNIPNKKHIGDEVRTRIKLFRDHGDNWELELTTYRLTGSTEP